MKRSDQQPKHRVKLWLEQDGCPVTDTTAAIAARKRAKLLGKDQGRDKEHTVSGTLSGCLFTSLQETCDSKGRKIVGKQVIPYKSVLMLPIMPMMPGAVILQQSLAHQ